MVVPTPESAFYAFQLLWTGDFLQLSPVALPREQPKYAFQAKSWARVIQNHILLTSVYRQSDQGIPLSIRISLPNATLDFIHTLNCCRTANLDDKSVSLLSTLSRPISQNFLPNYDAIYLFPTRKEVDNFNKHRLLSIESPVVMFQSCDWCSGEKVKPLFKSLPVGPSVHLKIGAQVMLVRNLDEGLTNGTIGIVKGFYMYREATGDESYHKKVGFVRNIPITNEGVPISHSSTQDGSSASTPVPLIEFYHHEVSEHVLILPMEFQAELDGKPAVKRIQVFLVFDPCLTHYSCDCTDPIDFGLGYHYP